MAEGLLRKHGGECYAAFSAGTHPHVVHPLAVKVMSELDIDISEHAGYWAKGIKEFAEQLPMDLVVTVCDEAAEECPFFSNTQRQMHWNFPDPSSATGTDQEREAVLRHVRDLIAARITLFLYEEQHSTVYGKEKEI